MVKLGRGPEEIAVLLSFGNDELFPAPRGLTPTSKLGDRRAVLRSEVTGTQTTARKSEKRSSHPKSSLEPLQLRGGLCRRTSQGGGNGMRVAIYARFSSDLDLLVAAQAQQFDAVQTESINRLSRDLEDIAGLHKRLAYWGVKIVTLADGEVGKLHVGLRQCKRNERARVSKVEIDDGPGRRHVRRHARLPPRPPPVT
jgi:hypothetical protein